MVKNGKSDKTRSDRKQIMPREIKTMLRAPAVLNAKEARKFRAVLKEVAEFVKPQDPFARFDVEDYAYDRVEDERIRGLKTAVIKRPKSERLKRALTELKAKYDQRKLDARDAAETKLLADLSEREALPDKAELERLEAESNAELAKLVAKLQSEFEAEKKRIKQEISSLDDAMFLEHWMPLYEQLDRFKSTTEKRTENTRSRLERRVLGEPLRNRAEIIDGTAIEEPAAAARQVIERSAVYPDLVDRVPSELAAEKPLVAQQPLIVPAATRPDLPPLTATGSQPESVAAVLTVEEPEALRPQVMTEPTTEFGMPDQAATGSHVETGGAEGRAEEPEALRPQVMIEPPTTQFDMLEPTGSQVEAPVAELTAAKPDMLEAPAELAAEEAVRQLVAIEPPAAKFDMLEPPGSRLEALVAELPAAKPDMLEAPAEFAAEEAVRQLVAIEPPAAKFDMLEPPGSQLEALVAELPAAKPDMLEPAAELAAEEAVRQLVAVESPATKFDMAGPGGDQLASGNGARRAPDRGTRIGAASSNRLHAGRGRPDRSGSGRLRG
jgi:hypothetical protein